MNPEITKLNERITALERVVESLRNASTIPLDMNNAFKDRIGLKDSPLAVFSKAVSEGGASSYSVAKIPDGNYITSDNRLIPYYKMP